MKRRFSVLLAVCLALLLAVPALAADSYTPFATTPMMRLDGKLYYDVYGTGARDMTDTETFLRQVLSARLENGDGTQGLPLYEYWKNVSGLVFAENAGPRTFIYDTIDNFEQYPALHAEDKWRTIDGAYGPLRSTNKISVFKDIFVDAVLPTVGGVGGIHKDEFAPEIADQPMFFVISNARMRQDDDSGGWAEIAYATLFYDFQLAYINTAGQLESGLPDTINDINDAIGSPGFKYHAGSDQDTYTTGVKNLTGSEITASQAYAVGHSYTLQNSISEGIDLGFRQMIGHETTVSAKIPVINVGVSSTQKVEFSASQNFSMTKGTTTTNQDSETVTSSLSVVLPPHSETLLKQSQSQISMEIVYDYPVAITYKVKTVGLWGRWGEHDDRVMTCLATFGRDEDPNHASAVDNLARRWGVDQDMEKTYGDNIVWTNTASRILVNEVTDSLNSPFEIRALKDYLNLDGPLYDPSSAFSAWAVLDGHRPMSVTGGTLTSTSKGFSTAVHDIVPSYPLHKVSTDRSYDYDMTTGEQLYVDNIAVQGVNMFGVPYYGFNSRQGRWTLVDAAGNPLPHSDVAALVKDPVSGNTSLVAGQSQGTVYLKYVIDEDRYSYSNNIGSYTKNADLSATAVVKVNVAQAPFTGKVEAAGTVVGTVNDPAINLDNYPGLTASATDQSGKHLDRAMTWDAKELEREGIKIDNNNLTFTKAGTFHIRASSGSVSSEWLTVTARPARELDTLTIADNTSPSVLSVDVRGGAATVDLSLLTVSALDQYGDAYTNLAGLQWKCDNSLVTISGTTATVDKKGSYDLYAQLGGTVSNKLTLTVASPLPDLFTDDNGHWAEAYINALGVQRYVNGVSRQRYAPDAPMTRAQFVQLLYNVWGQGAVSPAAPFTDTVAGAWYERALNWAYERKLITGYGTTRVGPNDAITREQMAVLLVRSADAFGVVLPTTSNVVVFTDDHAIAAWASSAVYALRQAGIVDGQPNNIFSPQSNLTRGEMAKVMVQTLTLAGLIDHNNTVD